MHMHQTFTLHLVVMMYSFSSLLDIKFNSLNWSVFIVHILIRTYSHLNVVGHCSGSVFIEPWGPQPAPSHNGSSLCITIKDVLEMMSAPCVTKAIIYWWLRCSFMNICTATVGRRVTKQDGWSSFLAGARSLAYS